MVTFLEELCYGCNFVSLGMITDLFLDYPRRIPVPNGPGSIP